MANPSLVTFDVYTALVDISGSLTPVVSGLLGLDETSARSFVALWRVKQLERAQLSNSLHRGRTSFRDVTAMSLDYTAERLGHNVNDHTRKELIRAWADLKPLPEADAVIGAVKAKGYKTGILSNGDCDMLSALAGNFSAKFDFVFSSETAGWYKPHPSVYDLPADALKIGRSDYLHVAGSPSDVMGASAAGVRCYWSSRLGEVLLDRSLAPERVGPDLRGVLDML